MINTKLTTSEDGQMTELCESYSDSGYCLMQTETGIIYGSSVIDSIDHYEDGKPVSRFHYEETDKKEMIYDG